MNSIKICLQGAFTTVKAFHSLMTLNTLGTFVLMLSSFHFPTSIVPAEAMAMMPRPSMSTRLNPVTVNLGVVADPGSTDVWDSQTICLHRSLTDPMPDYPNEHIKAWAGIYHGVGKLNGSTIWKSMEFGQYAFAPLCTGYIWFSNTYSVHFLSERVHDEQVLMDSEVKWDELGIVAMFKGGEVFYPWDAWFPQADLQVSSYFEFSQNMMSYLETSLLNQLSEFEHAEATAGELAEDEPMQAEATAGELAEDEPMQAEATSDPHPTNIVGARPKACPPLPMVHNFGTINPPPAPVLPPIQKKGYMAKAIALLVALDLGLYEKVTRIRNVMMRSRAFQTLFDSHMRVMTETGNDDRFDYS